jgi:hypothetical protein
MNAYSHMQRQLNTYEYIRTHTHTDSARAKVIRAIRRCISDQHTLNAQHTTRPAIDVEEGVCVEVDVNKNQTTPDTHTHTDTHTHKLSKSAKQRQRKTEKESKGAS